MTAMTSNTQSWVVFTKVSFALAVGMIALGIWGLPGDLWVKGYLGMASIYLMGATFTLAKTMRDEHEAKKLASRIDEAKAERLLLDIERGT